MTFYRIPIAHPTTYLSHHYLLKFKSSEPFILCKAGATRIHIIVWRSVPKLQQAVRTFVIFIAEKFYYDSTFKYYSIHNYDMQGEPGVDYDEPNLDPLVCDLCKKQFESLDTLGEHQKKYHNMWNISNSMYCESFIASFSQFIKKAAILDITI
jgi:hypothetical protein